MWYPKNISMKSQIATVVCLFVFPSVSTIIKHPIKMLRTLCVRLVPLEVLNYLGVLLQFLLLYDVHVHVVYHISKVLQFNDYVH